MFPNKAVEIASRQYRFPDHLSESLEVVLRKLGFSFKKPSALADAVKKLSDHYIQNPTSSTPWHFSWAQAAYLAYFFPLNYARTNAVFDELRRVNFFKGLDRFIDFGCGVSSVPLLVGGTSLVQGVGVDKSVEALHLLEDFLVASRQTPIRLYQKFNGIYDDEKELGIFSYVLTETQKLPPWAVDLEALLIVEPSTRQDGRYLLDLREALIEDGYFAWAPCTHQKPCPLFNRSKRDWCHDRIHLEFPQWYNELEKNLPMKNRTVTFSYLAVRRTPPVNHPHLARSVGDLLDEKGKYRQLICRSEDREFLAWLKKEHKDVPGLKRGHLFEIPEIPKVSDELRVPPEVQIRAR